MRADDGSFVRDDVNAVDFGCEHRRLAAVSTSRGPGAAQPYHHGDLRAALVEEALGLVREGGLAALSLREATRRAGVTPGAAYRHFRGRDELVAAAAREIQDRMAEGMRAAAEPTQDDPGATAAEHALARLRGVGLGYLAFARAEPGWFETVFFGGGFGRGGEVLPAAGEGTPGEQAVAPPFAELVAALDACRDAGVLPPERRAGAEFVCWSAVHGCAELIIHGPLMGADPALLDALAERVVDDIIAGVRGPGQGGSGA